MYCSYCRQERPQGDRPCPHCGMIPPPVMPEPEAGTKNAWGGNSEQIPFSAPLAEHLPPGEGGHQAEITYMPPAYTRPRPIIARRRAIYGLLSVLIASVLLCGSVGFYLTVSGTFSTWGSLLTGTKNQPERVQPTPTISDPLPDEHGPAEKFVPVVALTERVIANNIPSVHANEFKPGTTIYLTFTIAADVEGTLVVKWYLKDMKRPFGTSDEMPITKEAFAQNAVASILAGQAAPGMVEIYWDDQLAQRLYFAVR